MSSNKRNTRKRTAKTQVEPTQIESTVVENTVNDDAAELAAIEAMIAQDEQTQALPVSEEIVEAAVAAVQMDEVKAEIYQSQESQSDGDTQATVPVVSKPKRSKGGGRKARSTGSTRGGMLKSVVGAKEKEFFALQNGDENVVDFNAVRDSVLTTVDMMAKKVGEKAVNLADHICNGRRLSVYTAIAARLLFKQGEINAKELIAHLQDGKANGVKSYSPGTANSQGHQMFSLLPALKIAIRDGKVLRVNPESRLNTVLMTQLAA
jgi:hypothetical protein